MTAHDIRERHGPIRRRVLAVGAVGAVATLGTFLAVPALASAPAATRAAAPAAVQTHQPPAAAPVTAESPGAGPSTITGPIPSTAKPGDPSHDYVFYSTPFDLKKAGYEEQEYFISGTATRYPPNPTSAQQMQPATPIGTMPYETRIVVRRPINPHKSAGIAVVDWQNVTAGHDIDTEWGTSGDFYVRHGWTWIGASVQHVGVNGATSGPTAGLGLKEWNPQRYGPLDVTDGGTVLDDSQSFDIYTQIGELAKGTNRHDPLAGLRISDVYAGGASQSGHFLGIYYNTIQPLQHVYDGFLFALTDSSLPPRSGVGAKAIRVFTETDIYRGAGVASQTVPDSPTLRTWEIAGASHVPAYATSPDANDFRATLGGIQTREFGPSAPFDCVNPGPSQVQSWAVFHDAYAALNDWVQKGIPPRAAQPLAVIDPGPPATFVRDQNGIAEGGIRLPDVEVPTALNNGVNAPANLDNPLSVFCVLFGTHVAFTQDQLGGLYDSDKEYRQQVGDDVKLLEDQHFLLPEDGKVFIEEARHAHVAG
jgi:Alpha/beta hydrolase domain